MWLASPRAGAADRTWVSARWLHSHHKPWCLAQGTPVETQGRTGRHPYLQSHHCWGHHQEPFLSGHQLLHKCSHQRVAVQHGPLRAGTSHSTGRGLEAPLGPASPFSPWVMEELGKRSPCKARAARTAGAQGNTYWPTGTDPVNKASVLPREPGRAFLSWDPSWALAQRGETNIFKRGGEVLLEERDRPASLLPALRQHCTCFR